MKVKHALIVLVLGYCFDFIGALLKILHHPNGNAVLVIATALKVAGALLLLYKLITYPRIKDFLNS